MLVADGQACCRSGGVETARQAADDWLSSSQSATCTFRHYAPSKPTPPPRNTAAKRKIPLSAHHPSSRPLIAVVQPAGPPARPAREVTETQRQRHRETERTIGELSTNPCTREPHPSLIAPSPSSLPPFPPPHPGSSARYVAAAWWASWLRVARNSNDGPACQPSPPSYRPNSGLLALSSCHLSSPSSWLPSRRPPPRIAPTWPCPRSCRAVLALAFLPLPWLSSSGFGL
jgi:hypothetical protein